MSGRRVVWARLVVLDLIVLAMYCSRRLLISMVDRILVPTGLVVVGVFWRLLMLILVLVDMVFIVG